VATCVALASAAEDEDPVVRVLWRGLAAKLQDVAVRAPWKEDMGKKIIRFVERG
jgi:hypothetical protein